MSEFSTLSSKGQLVIPKKIRDQTGWQPGDQLEIEWLGDRLELRKTIKKEEKPQASLVRELLGKYQTGNEEGLTNDEKPRELRKNLYGKLDS